MDELGVLFGKTRNKNTLVPDDRLVSSRTYLGLEFEFEGVSANWIDISNASHYWEAKKEDSLHDHGMEFVFREPLFGADVLLAIEFLLSKAVEYKWKCTKRTGIHVHLDARDLSYPQLMGLIIHYLIFEPALYAWVGRDREANNFCLPWYKAEGSILDAAGLLKAINNAPKKNKLDQGIKELADEFHKYAGLNLKALANYGSIEFRQLETTTSLPEILDWINIILSLKQASLKSPDSSFPVISRLMNGGPRKALEKVFPKHIVERMLLNNTCLLDEIVQIGVPNAIELLSDVERAHPVEGASTKEMSAKDWVTPPTKDPHPGYVKWVEESFPKGENLHEEKPPPKGVDPKNMHDVVYGIHPPVWGNGGNVTYSTTTITPIDPITSSYFIDELVNSLKKEED